MVLTPLVWVPGPPPDARLQAATSPSIDQPNFPTDDDLGAYSRLLVILSLILTHLRNLSTALTLRR